MTGANQVDVERWGAFWKQANADSDWRAFHDTEDEQRERVRPEILELLDQFQSSQIDVELFRAEFDKRTRKVWDVFGLKGMSGAMFLNKLVKYMPNLDELTGHLTRVLVLPVDETDAVTKLGAFSDYMQQHIDAGNVTKGDLQPARAPFLISAFWHMQDTEQWPIWYTSGRKILAAEGLVKLTGNVNDDYFAFRKAFQLVASALRLTSWQFEHLLVWRNRPSKVTKTEQPQAALSDDEETNDAVTTDAGTTTHAQVQWLLAKIGHKFGCQVWIATNDRSKTWNGQKLGELSIDTLPNLGLDEWPQKIIGLIDVVWLKGKQITAAFEVEHTTSIYSGVLRMSDLVVEVPNLTIPLYLIAPKSRIEKVRQQLNRPTFRKLELHEKCAFFSSEELIDAAEGMLKWASDASALSELAEFVEPLADH